MIRIGEGALSLESDTALLRTALALSCATGRPFRWERFGRKGTGLTARDVEAVHLFAAITGARVGDGALGDASIELEPGPVAGGEHRFDASPAASALPLLRTALVPLARIERDVVVTITGSTHAPGGETFEVVDSTFRYLLQRMGVKVSFTLDCAGFAPRGGGAVTAHVEASEWAPLTYVEREPLEGIQIVSAGASLPAHVQQRQAARARSGVHISGFEPTVQLLKIRARSAGSVVAVTGQFGEAPMTFAAVSERGRSAESVGEEAAAAFRRFANQAATIPEALVTALLPFLPLVDGESRVSTPRLPATAPGQSALIGAFTGREIVIEGKVGKPAVIRVSA